MSRLMILLMLTGLAACGVPTQTQASGTAGPMRIVSLLMKKYLHPAFADNISKALVNATYLDMMYVLYNCG